jgi:hypothetical protein
MGEDPVAIIRDAVLRGANRTEIVRAAIACARAVVHLAPPANGDALAAVEAAERWTMNPSEDTAYAAFLAEKECLKMRGVKEDWNNGGDSTEAWALLSATMAGVSCVTDKHLYDYTVELCVDFAAKAAAGATGRSPIDFAIIVTSVLL